MLEGLEKDREDFQFVQARHEEMAALWRVPVPYYRTHLGPGHYDRDFPDRMLPQLWDQGLVPIVDLYEQVIKADGSQESEGQMLGWHAITRDCYAR